MFAQFFCDLLGFSARKFSAKSENPGNLLLTKGCIVHTRFYNDCVGVYIIVEFFNNKGYGWG